MGESGNSGEQSESASEHSEEHNEDGKSAEDLEARVDGADFEAQVARSNYRAGTAREVYSAKQTNKEKNKSNSKKPNANIAAAAMHSAQKVERTNHGTGLIIEYVDSETGDVTEYLFEQRVYDDKNASQRGKLGLMGGGIERIDGRLENSLENMIKEIRQEFEDPWAAEILIKRLEYIDTITDLVEGKPAYTYIYRARITSPYECHVISSSRSADGAGPRYRIKASDFTDNSIKPNDFIYSQGEFIFNYVAKRGIRAANPHSRNGHSMHHLMAPKVASFPTTRINNNLQYSQYNNNLSLGDTTKHLDKAA